MFFAIPGNILDGHSDGHHLIQEGAKLISSGQDVLLSLNFKEKFVHQINFLLYIELSLDSYRKNGLHFIKFITLKRCDSVATATKKKKINS